MTSSQEVIELVLTLCMMNLQIWLARSYTRFHLLWAVLHDAAFFLRTVQ